MLSKKPKNAVKVIGVLVFLFLIGSMVGEYYHAATPRKIFAPPPTAKTLRRNTEERGTRDLAILGEYDRDTTKWWVHFEKTLLRYNMVSKCPSQAVKAWFAIEPTVSCSDEEFVGKWGDGGKWVCGLRRLDQRAALENRRCIIYSFGSAGEDQFEQAVRVATNCEIHTFDPSSKKVKGNFHPFAIGPSDGDGMINLNGAVPPKQMSAPIKSLPTILKHLKHSQVDVMKIDVEGGEYGVFDTAFKSGILEKVGQIQVEVHWRSAADKPRVLKLFDQFHRAGFAVFHKEVNILWPKGCEFSLFRIPPLQHLFAPVYLERIAVYDYFARFSRIQQEQTQACGRTLVYECAGKADDCGGIGDRTTGMISAAAIASLTNRAFFVNIDNYDAVFTPGSGIDWRYTEHIRKCTAGKTKTYHFISKLDKFLEHKGDLDQVFPDQHVVLHSNRGILQHLLKNPKYGPDLKRHAFTPTNIWSTFFTHMFKPSDALKETVNAFPSLRNPDRLLISMHLRTGDGSFDTKRKWGLGHSTKLKKWLECAHRVAHSALPMWGAALNDTVRYVLFTDSKALKEHAKKLQKTSEPNLVTSDFDPVHINHKLYAKYRNDYGATMEFRRKLVETYAEWIAYSMGHFFLIDFNSGFSRTGVFSTFATRDAQFPFFAVINPNTCMPYSTHLLKHANKGAQL